MQIRLMLLVMLVSSAVCIALATILEESWPLFLMWPALATAIPFAREA